MIGCFNYAIFLFQWNLYFVHVESDIFQLWKWPLHVFVSSRNISHSESCCQVFCFTHCMLTWIFVLLRSVVAELMSFFKAHRCGVHCRLTWSVCFTLADEIKEQQGQNSRVTVQLDPGIF